MPKCNQLRMRWIWKWMVILNNTYNVSVLKCAFSYYCDICSELERLDTFEGRRSNLSAAQSRVVNQFRGLTCPNEPGRYQLEKKFCFNDWSVFDSDSNCKIDAIERAGKELGSYKSAFEALQQLGFVCMHFCSKFL